jgi:branched-chain amino acid transport system permease protein
MGQDLVSILSLGSIYLLFALGMSIAWGTIGILNFAHGSIFMFAAFTDYLIIREVRLPIIATIPIAVVAGALLAALVQLLAFEPILRNNKHRAKAELQILIGGIGVASVPLAVAQKVTKSTPFGFAQGSFKTHVYTVGGARVSNIQILVIGCGLGLGLLFALWLRYSRTGLALRSIGVDSEVASLMGVDRGLLAVSTMAMGGALAGLAGVLLTYNLGAISPESGDALLLKAFAAIVLGGVGSVAGVVVGAFVLAATETVVLTQTSGLWVDAVSFGLIFLLLLVRPQGIFGRQEVRRV